MTRAGRSSASAITADSTEAQVVGHFTFDQLADGLAPAAVAAIRDGVPVSRMVGRSMFQHDHVVRPADTTAKRRAAYEARAQDAHRRALRAKRRYLNAESDDEADEYTEVERAALRERRDMLAKIAALDTEVPTVPAGPFDAFTHVIVPSIARMVTCDNELEQDEVQALDRLMPDFAMERRDGVWWATATFLVPSLEGVAELRNVTWRVGVGGTGTGLLRAQVDISDAANTGSRAHLRGQLESAGLTPLAAQTVVNAPLPQLASAVLHGLTGLAFPEWVAEDWREPAFVGWVTSRYADPKFTWLGVGKYAYADPFRQAVLSYAAHIGRPFDVAELRTVMPLDDMQLLADLTREKPTPKGKAEPWYPCLVNLTPGPRFRSTSLVEALACACGRFADHALRSPEVPRGLLCDCGRMPDAARFGMPDDVRFPADYRQIKLSPVMCVALVREKMAARMDQWTGRSKDLLLLDGLHYGLTKPQAAAQLGCSQPVLWAPFDRLVQRGMVVRDEDVVPHVYRYTELGERTASQFRAEARESA